MVGERGVTLSGGQKQRTAIARALLRRPAILILDDALASVDTYTEERILSGLRSYTATATTILISHRVSTVRGADQIAVLDHGRIVEIGTARGIAGARWLLRQPLPETATRRRAHGRGLTTLSHAIAGSCEFPQRLPGDRSRHSASQRCRISPRIGLAAERSLI